MACFKQSLPSGVQFVESIDASVVRHFQEVTLADGYSAKTLRNRLMTVADFLKQAGSSTKVTWKNAPKAEKKPPRAYSDEELQKLFSKN